jgi:hypothetical protein
MALGGAYSQWHQVLQREHGTLVPDGLPLSASHSGDATYGASAALPAEEVLDPLVSRPRPISTGAVARRSTSAGSTQTLGCTVGCIELPGSSLPRCRTTAVFPGGSSNSTRRGCRSKRPLET